MIHVVLGMHKSGTTLVSEILHHSGIDMGDFGTGSGYDEGNTYERAETRAIDKEILREAGTTSHAIHPPDSMDLSPAIRRRMDDLIARLEGRGRDWGFKDPRATLTYPLWAAALPPHCLVAVYRPLHELTRRYGGDRSVKRAFAVVGAWYAHNARLLDILEGAQAPWIMISYPRLMEGEEELERLSAFLGRELTDRRQPGLRRGRRSASTRLRIAELAYRFRTGRWARSLVPRLEACARATPTPASA